MYRRIVILINVSHYVCISPNGTTATSIQHVIVPKITSTVLHHPEMFRGIMEWNISEGCPPGGLTTLQPAQRHRRRCVRQGSTTCAYRPLRSSTAGLLVVPKKMATKKHGEAAFCFYGPTAWNKLPLYLRQAGSVDIFKAQLKTYLYTIAFNWSFKLIDLLIPCFSCPHCTALLLLF